MSPDLSPMEGVWRLLKHTLGNRHFDNVEELYIYMDGSSKCLEEPQHGESKSLGGGDTREDEGGDQATWGIHQILNFFFRFMCGLPIDCLK